MLATLNQFDSYAFRFVKITINMAIILIYYDMNNIIFSSAVSITIIYFAPIYYFASLASFEHLLIFALLRQHLDVSYTLLSRIQCDSKEKYLFTLCWHCSNGRKITFAK